MGFYKIYKVKWRHAILAGMPCESLLSSCCMTRTKSDASKQCFRMSWLHPETKFDPFWSNNKCGLHPEPARAKKGPPVDGRPLFFTSLRAEQDNAAISDGRRHDHDRSRGCS